MQKQITIEQVRMGMFIQELNGSWIDHPFWKKAFLLNAPEDLQKLKSSPIKSLVIDISKGLDVEIESENLELPSTEVVASEPTLSEEDGSEAPAPEEQNQPDLVENPAPIVRLSAAEERAQAKRILSSAKHAVSSMFQEVRMGKALSAEAAMPLVEEISSSVSRNESALISLVRLKSKDDYTYMHSVAVCALMIALARELKLSESEVKQAGLAGLLHDIGKAAVSLDILNKPGALTNDEFALIKKHPALGHAMLLQANFKDQVALDVCLHHHEKVDGSGYPHGLKDPQISIFAKMGAVCDVYDAVTSNRPYKKGWEPGVSLQRMANWKGHFDEVIFKAFVRSVGIYPVGSAVMLKSGRLAVVIDQSPASLLTPVVKVFFSTRTKLRVPIEILDLSNPKVNDKIMGHEDPVLWGINNFSELWAAD